MNQYFGTDGIRGKVPEFLNFDLAFQVGRSLGLLNHTKVVIGRDTRESGPMLADAIIQGAKIAGLDCMNLGVVPTPLLSIISHELNCVGVMITASHNPYHDNGIKIFIAGKKLFESEEVLIEQYLHQEIQIPNSNRVGLDLDPINAFQVYLRYFDHLLVKTNFSVGLDTANGATFETAPMIFEMMTSSQMVISNHPDGKNINHGCGSTHLEAIIDLVKTNHLDYGFAFDGDGDRLLVVDKDLHVYDGDMMIYVMALYLDKQNKLNDRKVVLTKMSNLGIIRALENQGIDVIQTNVGDKYVLEALEGNDYTIGGENSGHIINRSLLSTGDGVLNACYLLHLLHQTELSLAQITKSVVMYPDRLTNLYHVKKDLVNHPEVVNLVQKIKEELGKDGKVLVRASGTEPLIRVSVSAKTETLVESHTQAICDLIHHLNQDENKGE